LEFPGVREGADPAASEPVVQEWVAVDRRAHGRAGRVRESEVNPATEKWAPASLEVDRRGVYRARVESQPAEGQVS
jgi:hypothetical protein